MTTNYILDQMNLNIPDGGSGQSIARHVPIMLSAVELGSGVALAADESNARVLHVTETNDTIFYLPFLIPKDYDPSQDNLKIRVMAAMLTVSTDDDVELEVNAYKKVAGSALGSDLAPTDPGTILSVTEQFVEWDLSGNSFSAGNICQIVLVTNGANDSNGEEIQIHAIEVEYSSCIVAAAVSDR